MYICMYMYVYMYPPKGWSLWSDLKEKTPLPPSLPPYKLAHGSVSWTAGSSVYADVNRGKKRPEESSCLAKDFLLRLANMHYPVAKKPKKLKTAPGAVSLKISANMHYPLLV